MAINLQDQLSIAEQGIDADRKTLANLQANRAAMAAGGEDTSSIDTQIAAVQDDINAGVQDVFDLQQTINDQALATQAVDETAVPNITEPEEDPRSLGELLDDAGFNDDETRNLANADFETDEDPEDAPPPPDDTPDPEDKSDDQANTTVAKATPPKEVPSPTPNPLHRYATYTYGITLYILTKEDFVTLQEADARNLSGWAPRNVLISSGGMHQDKRPAEFQDDFYFDNLKMTSVIGMNSRTRGSNAIDISFTIIEPYGLTLLDRIIDTAVNVAKSENYHDQPYMLEINFFGSSDLGEITTPIPGLTKRFPIKLLGIKIKTGTKGSEYAIQAIPYNHAALTETINSTPVNLEVVAGTVEEFFKNELTSSSFNDQTAEKKAAKERAEAASRALSPGDPDIDIATIEAAKRQQEEANKVLKAAYKVNSYPGGINAWHKNNADTKKITVPDSVAFQFHSDEIAQSKIVEVTKRDHNRAGMTPASKLSSTQVSAAGTAPAGLEKNKQTFNINAGTSVTDVINLILRQSEYIRSQIIDPLSDSKVVFPENQEVKFYKIIPQIKLNDFDKSRNVYGKHIIYHIVPYTYYNTKHPNLPYAKPGAAVKEYNYIYTGKNIDILDFSIDFDTAYYTTVVVDRKNSEKTNENVGADDNKENDVTRRPTGGTKTSIAMNKNVPIGNDYSVASTGSNTTETTLAASVVKNIYSDSRGDMINVKMKILGDPHFIKQDDLYVNPGHSNYPDKAVMINDGTLAMDNSEIFCNINFKTPVDMDDTTGLLRENQRYTESKFSGIYKIITVESEFTKGQFTQNLETIRIFDDNKEKAPTERSQGASPIGVEGFPPEREIEGDSPTEQDVLDSMMGDLPEPPGYSTDDEEANQRAVEEAIAADNELQPDPGDEEANELYSDEQEGFNIADDIGEEEEIDIGEVNQAQVDLGEFI